MREEREKMPSGKAGERAERSGSGDWGYGGEKCSLVKEVHGLTDTESQTIL